MEIWDFYFATLASWVLHPGYQREGAQVPSLEYVADLADLMMEVRNRRWQWSQERQSPQEPA